MRLQVKFRYRADTGEVEVFQVISVDDGPRDPRHDVRHDEATRNLARIVDPHARVIEEVPSSTSHVDTEQESPQGMPEQTAERHEPQREGPLR